MKQQKNEGKERRHMKTIAIINLKGGVGYEKLYIMQS